ncbi:MAG: glycosyltransferase family 2 protein [Syntrophales bacterium]
MCTQHHTSDTKTKSFSPRSKDEKKIRLDVIVPAHNEADTLQNTLHAIEAAIAECGLIHRFIIVDDGSADETWAMVNGLGSHLGGEVIGVRLSRNFGKDAAIVAGLAEADADIVVTIDADGQHPVDAIPKMVDAWRDGAMVVHGVKVGRLGDSWLQKTCIFLFTKLLNMITGKQFQGMSDFKLLDREVVRNLLACGDHHFFYRLLVSWLGYPSANVSVITGPQVRKSRWNLTKLAHLGMQAIILHTDLPIQAFFVVSALSSLGGLLLVIVLIGYLILGEVPSGYSTLLILSIMNLMVLVFAITVIGLYVKNILDQALQRPRCIVWQRTVHDALPEEKSVDHGSD